MENEDQEAILFHTYECAYYVQSPSTVSHANSLDTKTNFHLNLDHSCTSFLSPTRSDHTTATLINNTTKNHHKQEATRLVLSHYSSSRGSTNCFLHEKTNCVQGMGEDDHEEILGQKVMNKVVVVDGGFVGGGGCYDEEVEHEEDSYWEKIGGWWWKYCSFRRSRSCFWVSLQLIWRFMVSLSFALLVFYVATKPPPPNVSVKVDGIKEFTLGEGVDATGVTTKILTCNIFSHLIIDNRSKLFGIHLHPPLLDLSFGELPVAISRGTKMYADPDHTTLLELNVGTRNKPMYGAGRAMQDMLDSGAGLPILFRVSFSSDFHVVWNIIKPKFHHQGQCLLLLGRSDDKKYQTQIYNVTCTMS